MGQVDGAFEHYDGGAPAIVPVVITQDTVEEVASQLSGSAGPGGTDGEDLKGWLLWYSVFSATLREELAALTNWIAVNHPPWAAYRGLMAYRLVALDKELGTLPVGIREIYR